MSCKMAVLLLISPAHLQESLSVAHPLISNLESIFMAHFLKTEYPFLQLLKSRIHGICKTRKTAYFVFITLPSFSQLVIV